MSSSLFHHLPNWVYRLLKLSPLHYRGLPERWDNRTYPCWRWGCFRRSPAWRSFERGGLSYCDKHIPHRDSFGHYPEDYAAFCNRKPHTGGCQDGFCSQDWGG